MLHGYITYMTQFIRKTPNLWEAQTILLNYTVFFCAMFLKPLKQRCTKGYKRYKETSGLIEWKECQIFHSIFT